MVNSAHIQKYLQRLQDKYQQWWKLYGLIDEEYEPFDFRVEVQTEEPAQEGALTQHSSEKKTILLPFPVLDGIDRYVAKEPVLIVGQPGSGKSTALVRFLLKSVEQARQDSLAPIPVLIELRRYKTQVGTLMLIQDSLKRLGLKDADIEELRVAERPFLLLLDGLNELPSKQALTDLRNFREDCSDLGISMVVTTRALDGDNLGIKRQLEIKSLTPSEIQRFLQTCLPQESKQRFQELSDRLRELGQTPLMLWMLYVVLKEPQGQIPNSRGELFRRFIQVYERKREEKIYLDEDNKLDGETRRWWTRLLKPLAFEMMRSGKSGEPTDFCLEILKRDAETICKDFLKAQAVNNYSDLAIRCLDALVRHHLIQLDLENREIKFCHQLLQEYYAAEWLLERLPELSDEQLKYYFLNYLKWTEAIGLMLGLIGENDFGRCGKEQAIRVVKLALGIDSPPAVDLMLGARLAGEVQHEFQAKTTRLISNLKTQQFPKVTYLGNTRSEYAVCDIKEFLANENLEIRKNAVKALGQISTQYSVEVLDITFNDKESVVREATAVALGKIGNERATQLLTQKIKDESDDKVRGNIADALGEIGSELAGFVLKKWKNQEDESAYTTIRIEVALCKIFGDIEKPELFKKIIPNEPLFEPDSLKNITEEDALDSLTEELKHETWTVRRKAVIRLSERKEEQKAFLALLQTVNDVEKIVRRESVYALRDTINPTAIPALLKALKDECPLVRRSAAFTLGNIRNQEAVYGLSQALQDSDRSVVVNSINALEKIGGEKAALVLIREFNKGDPRTCEKCLRAIGEIGHTIATPDLLRVLSDSKHPASSLVGMNFFQVLGKVADEKLLPDFLCWQAQAIESRNIEIFAKAIAAIQNCCQFYNYEIAQSDPPPAVKQASGVGNQEQTINIGSVGILNTGHVTIHGDQIGDTSNG